MPAAINHYAVLTVGRAQGRLKHLLPAFHAQSRRRADDRFATCGQQGEGVNSHVPRAASCQNIGTMRQHFEIYPLEADSFEADVRVLIQNTLRAALDQLSGAAQAELTAIETALKKTTDSEAQEHLVDEHVDVLAQELSQQRFLRNMALVALASRLTHAVRKMTGTAEHFRPRKKRYGSSSASEFERLWKEYTDRFSIDFNANASRIAFVEPMPTCNPRARARGHECPEQLQRLVLRGGSMRCVAIQASRRVRLTPCPAQHA